MFSLMRMAYQAYQSKDSSEVAEQEPLQDIDYDAFEVLMKELSSGGEPDGETVNTAWEAVGPRGQQLIAEDGVMGPKVKELGLAPGMRPEPASGLLDRVAEQLGGTFDAASSWASGLGDSVAAAGQTANDTASAATEGVKDKVAAFMTWIGGGGHGPGSAPEAGAQAEIQVEAASTAAPEAEPEVQPEPQYADNLELASEYLGVPTSYKWGAKEKEWSGGVFDCSTFTLNIMKKAGYDIHKETEVDGPQASESEAEADTSVYALTQMTEESMPERIQARMDHGDREVEELLAKHNIDSGGGMNERVEKLPEGADKERARQLRATAAKGANDKLRELVEAGDPRTMGAIFAMEAAEFGRRVALEEVKPGDVIQTWILYKSGAIFGHSTQVFAIDCDAVVRGETAPQTMRIDASTDPASILRVEAVHAAELIGAHSATDQAAGGVYVKPPETLDVKGNGGRFDRVYAGRLSGSRWAQWQPSETDEGVPA